MESYIADLFNEIDTNKPRDIKEALETLTQEEEKLFATFLSKNFGNFYKPIYRATGAVTIIESALERIVYNPELLQKYESIFNKLEFAIKPVTLHFLYNFLSDYFYKLRKTDHKYFYKAKEVCVKDLYIYPDYCETLQIAYLPTIPRLISILKQENKIDDAINVCKFALFNGIVDTHTASGYRGRLERLLKLKKK